MVATRLPFARTGTDGFENRRQTHCRYHQCAVPWSKRARCFVAREEALPDTLKKLLTPISQCTRMRKRSDSFIANSRPLISTLSRTHRIVRSERPATFRVTGLKPEWWNPFSGEVRRAVYQPEDQCTSVLLKLEPYESRVVVFSDHVVSENPTPEKASGAESIDLSNNWSVTFSHSGESEKMSLLHSWSDDEKHRFYSGQAVYEKTIQVSERFLTSHTEVILAFGKGTPVD